MKKIIALIITIMLASCVLVGCGNYDMFDTNYTYDTAIIEMPGGEVVTVAIKQWCDYEGEQIQIIAEDGTVYLTSTQKCILLNTK